MNDQHHPPIGKHPVDSGANQAWLFDLDGVLTQTATVHSAAWKHDWSSR